MMIDSAFLVAYAIASIALAAWLRRMMRGSVDWNNDDMRRPVMGRSFSHILGTGALGAADAVSTSILGAATPSAVVMFTIVVGGLIGVFLGAGVLPALFGGIGQPNIVGMLAFVVATFTWAYIGGKLTLPLTMLALAIAPALIGLAAIVFGVMFFTSFAHDGRSNTHWLPDAWEERFGARVDYNMCAAGTSILVFGSPILVEQKCRQRVVGQHPVVGRFAGIYSCGARHIAAIVDVSQIGQFREGLKSVEIDFSDNPQAVFPLGAFGGDFFTMKDHSEYRSNAMTWIQRAGKGWGIPNEISVTSEGPDHVEVKLLNTPCTPLEARRCRSDGPNSRASCKSEFEQQGVTLHVESP